MGKRESLLGVRLNAAEREALDHAAAEKGIGISPLVRMILRDWLRAGGYLKAD